MADETEEFEFRARAEREAGAKPAAPPKAPPAPTAPKRSLLDRGVDAYLGLQEIPLAAGSSMVGAMAGNVAGAAKAVTSGDFGTQEGIRKGQETGSKVADALTYRPRTEFAKDTLQGAGKLFEESKLGGLNPSMPLGTVPGARALSSTAGKVAEGGRAAAEVPGKAVAAAVGKVRPETADIARKAASYGIELRPDMLSDNKFVRMIGEALESVPASGSKAEGRQIAFNRALGNLVGADVKAQRLTPDVFDRAMTQSGEKIGAIAGGASIPLTQADEALSAIVARAAKFETDDVAKIATNYVDELRGKAVDGVIPGEAYRKWNTDIGRKIRTAESGDLKAVLGDVQDVMLDALGSSITPEQLEAFNAARKQYAIGKALEPLVAKSKNGDISPAGLMAAATATKDKKSAMARGKGGDMGELARIGQMFLKEPGSSNTTERGLIYGLLGGGAAFSPTAAAGVYGAANAYNRLGPKLASKLVEPQVVP